MPAEIQEGDLYGAGVGLPLPSRKGATRWLGPHLSRHLSGLASPPPQGCPDRLARCMGLGRGIVWVPVAP